MKFNNIFKRYLNNWFYFNFIVSIVMLITSDLDDEYLKVGLFFISFFSLIFSFFFIKKSIYQDISFYSSTRMILTIFIISLITLFFYKIMYYMYSGTWFEFYAKDSIQYDAQAERLSYIGLIDGISHLLYMGYYDDLGAILATYFSYLFYPSTLSFNFMNILAGMLTLLFLFRLSLFFMNEKYAFLCCMVYGLSSFTIYFSV